MPFNYEKHADFRPTEEVSKIFKNCYCFGAVAGAGITAATISANLALVGTLVSTVGAISIFDASQAPV